jgi:exonuclease III
MSAACPRAWIRAASSRSRPEDRRRRDVKIATFNINNVVKRLDNLIDWLAEAEPDVVCLQELKVEQGAFPAGPLAQLGYNAVWKDQRTWNGMAILARGSPVVLAGDYNVVPTEADIYQPHHWRDDALLQPQVRAAYQRPLGQGWTDALRRVQPIRPVVRCSSTAHEKTLPSP